MSILVIYTTEGMNGSTIVTASQAGVFSKHNNLRHKILKYNANVYFNRIKFGKIM
jgi:hypothetical protein